MSPYPCVLSIESPCQVAAPPVRLRGDCLASRKIPLKAPSSRLRAELAVSLDGTRKAPLAAE